MVRNLENLQFLHHATVWISLVKLICRYSGASNLYRDRWRYFYKHFQFSRILVTNFFFTPLGKFFSLEIHLFLHFFFFGNGNSGNWLQCGANIFFDCLFDFFPHLYVTTYVGVGYRWILSVTENITNTSCVTLLLWFQHMSGFFYF